MNEDDLAVTGAELTLQMRPNRIPITNYVDGWSWRCGICGFLAIDASTSAEGAERDAEKHFALQHGHPPGIIATVTPKRDAEEPAAIGHG